MRYMLPFFVLLLMGSNIKAQNPAPDTTHKKLIRICAPTREQLLHPPLYVLYYGKHNSCITKDNLQLSAMIAPLDIKSINIIKGPGGVNKYGSEAEYGVIEVYLKKQKKPNFNAAPVVLDTTIKYRR